MGAEWSSSRAATGALQRKREAAEGVMRAPSFRARRAGLKLDRVDGPPNRANIALLIREQRRAMPIKRDRASAS
jgi:hypothetical protein